MKLPLVLAIGVSVLAAPVAASAQAARPERPYRGLFGSGYGNTEQSLTGSVSAGAGYDDNVYAGDNGSLLPQAGAGVARSSQFTSFSGSLGYGLSREKISLYANGSSAAQYYFDLRRPLVTSYSAGTGLSWHLSKRTQMGANGSFSYEPLSAFSFFPTVNEVEPGEVPPPNALPPGNYGTIRSAFVSASSSVSISHQLSQRSSLSGSLARGTTYNTSGGLSASGGFSASTSSASATFTHDLSKGLGLRAGYGYTRADYGGSVSALPPVVGRTIDLGLSYNHALSFSRRTTLSFGTGSSAYNYQSTTSYFVTGNAALNHEIGRSWNATLSFNRGVSFLNQLAAPTISDSLTAGVGGLISHRVHFHGSVAGSSGQVGLSLSEGSHFGSWAWSAGASFDTNRLVSLSVQYGYYHYNFDQTGFLIPGVPPQLNRHSIQGNVSVFLPIFQRTRRP